MKLWKLNLYSEAIAKFPFSSFLSFLRKQEYLSFNGLDSPAFAGVTENGNFAIASSVLRRKRWKREKTRKKRKLAL